MPEWLNGHDWKSCNGPKPVRGFESPSLRCDCPRLSSDNSGEGKPPTRGERWAALSEVTGCDSEVTGCDVARRGPCSAIDRRGPCVAIDRRGPCVAIDRRGPCVAIARRGPCLAIDRRGPCLAIDRRGPCVAIHRPAQAGDHRLPGPWGRKPFPRRLSPPGWSRSAPGSRTIGASEKEQIRGLQPERHVVGGQGGGRSCGGCDQWPPAPRPARTRSSPSSTFSMLRKQTSGLL